MKDSPVYYLLVDSEHLKLIDDLVAMAAVKVGTRGGKEVINGRLQLWVAFENLEILQSILVHGIIHM